MGIDGTPRHWDVTQPASTSLKRLASETPEQAFTRQRVRELQAYLATQGIKLDLAGEEL